MVLLPASGDPSLFIVVFIVVVFIIAFIVVSEIPCVLESLLDEGQELPVESDDNSIGAMGVLVLRARKNANDQQSVQKIRKRT